MQRRRESMSMSPVLRPDPSRKIHTQESFFWFRKPGNNQDGADGISEIEVYCLTRETEISLDPGARCVHRSRLVGTHMGPGSAESSLEFPDSDRRRNQHPNTRRQFFLSR